MKTKNILLVGLISIIIIINGCIPSLHPLYTDDDLVFEASLLDKWFDTESSDSWTFGATDENIYKLTLVQTGTPSNFVVHLLKLDDNYFLDFYPDDNDVECKENSFYLSHIIYAHTFAKIIFNNDGIEILSFDPSWLDELFNENKIRISHEEVINPSSVDEPMIVLTASTQELQKFVKKYANDENAYIHSVILKKNI